MAGDWSGQNVVVWVALYGGEVGDAFVLQGGLAHQERVKIRHHNRHAQRVVKQVLGHHGHDVGLATPNQPSLVIEHAPGQAGRGV